MLSPRVREGTGGKEEAFGVVGETGFLNVGGGGGGIAFRSFSTSSCFETCGEDTLIKSEGDSVASVVVILGVSSEIGAGASCFVLTSAREEEWLRNHARSDHGGCL